MKKQTKKAMYQKPAIEVIGVENEAGVMAGSGNFTDINSGGGIYQSSSPGTTRTGTKHQAQNPMQELEDMINDFLTF